MTWFPTIGQRIDHSPNGWTAAFGLRENPSPYLEEAGFTMDDWNFALADAIPNPCEDPSRAAPVLCGYGQGKVSPGRLRRAERARGAPAFDVCFFTLERSRCLVRGVYLGARYVSDDDAKALKKQKETPWTALMAKRAEAVAALYPDAPGSHRKRFLKDCATRWLVDPAHVLFFKEPVVVKPPGDASRFSNALNWGAKPWWEWVKLDRDPGDLDDLPASWEGLQIVVTHKARERDPAFTAGVKARRLAAQGHLACECCGLDTGRLYGSGAAGVIEGHHTDPLGAAPSEGRRYTDADIVLLCGTCHRVAHRTGNLTLPALKSLLPAGWAFVHPKRT